MVKYIDYQVKSELHSLSMENSSNTVRGLHVAGAYSKQNLLTVGGDRAREHPLHTFPVSGRAIFFTAMLRSSTLIHCNLPSDRVSDR